VRYIIYVKHLDAKFINSIDLYCLSDQLDPHIDKLSKMDVCIYYLDTIAVLLSALSSLVTPPATDSIEMAIQWVHVDSIEPRGPHISRNDTPTKLQLTYAKLYAKTMHLLLKSVHSMIKTHFLQANNSSASEIVNLLLQYLQCFQRNCTVPTVVQDFFQDALNFMDAIIFNETILRKDLCTFSSAFTLKLGTEEIIRTLSEQGGTTWFGDTQNWFLHTKQLINCLSL